MRTAGTNCELELAHAFELAGARTQLSHLKKLIENPETLLSYELIGFPGGFSYGDDISAGTIFAHHLKQHLLPVLKEAISKGTLIIGICNGFQILTKCGLLPAVMDNDALNSKPSWLKTPVGHLSISGNL